MHCTDAKPLPPPLFSFSSLSLLSSPSSLLSPSSPLLSIPLPPLLSSRSLSLLSSPLLSSPLLSSPLLSSPLLSSPLLSPSSPLLSLLSPLPLQLPKRRTITYFMTTAVPPPPLSPSRVHPPSPPSFARNVPLHPLPPLTLITLSFLTPWRPVPGACVCGCV